MLTMMPSRRVVRCSRGEADLFPLAEVVDLHDDTVDVVPERVAVRFHPLAEREDALEVVEGLDALVDRESERREPLEHLVVRAQAGPAFVRPDLIRVQREIATGGDARILLTQAARRRVAGIREQPLARLLLALVQRLEGSNPHEHLAAHLEHTRHAFAGQPLRNLFEGSEVLGDVLTGDAVTTRRTDPEPAVGVLQRDREPVELRLGDVPYGSRDGPLDARAPCE
jgi:hypothetical protein